MEVSQIGSENVHGFSCGNFLAAKDPVLGGWLALAVACQLSLPSTRSTHPWENTIK